MAFYKNGRNRGNFSRDMSAAGARLKSALGRAMRGRARGRMSSGSRSSRRGAEYGNITFQNDEHQMYRRKRAPRRVRIKARRAYKRFNYMLNKSLGLHSMIIPTTQTMTAVPTTGSDAQVCAFYSIYGGGTNSTTVGTQTNPANGDLNFLMRAHENSTAALSGVPSTKFRFRSAVMNLNIKNTATTDASYRDGLCFVDLYHVVCRKNITDSTGGGSAITVWADAIAHTPTLAGVNAVNVNSDSITPFDIGQFGQMYTIRRVRRVRLSAQQTFSTQIRDAGDYEIEFDDISRWNHLANKTEGFMIVAYNPSAVPGTGVRGSVSLEVNCNKKYHYTVAAEAGNFAGRGNLI